MVSNFDKRLLALDAQIEKINSTKKGVSEECSSHVQRKLELGRLPKQPCPYKGKWLPPLM